MTSRAGPVYEAEFFIDRDTVDEFDRWLEDHVRNVLREPGIIDCYVAATADDGDGRARRVCFYAIDGDEALDAFLDGPGADIDNQLESLFPDLAASDGRVLREDVSPDVVIGASPNCLNCGTRLRGQYCGTCGQRSRSRLISLWELVSDAFGDLFEIDSRLWQTLIPLMVRPGRLTHDYLQGRRARFMPPFRMYLVLSLLFFLVAFFDPREDLSLLFEPEPEVAVEETGQSDAEEVTREVLEDLTEEGAVIGDHPSDDAEGDEGGFSLRVDHDAAETDPECDVDASDLEDLPDWLARRMTVERLQRVCERTQIDGGRAFVDKIMDNVPAALIVLLPLMAFVLKALYPLSKRYYVEHLLFFVHFHAFFFLMLSLQILFARVSSWLWLPEALVVLTLVVTSFYIPVYLFVAMRRVYGQGRIVTFLKYVVLVIAYLLGFMATMLGALTIAAFSI